MEKRIIFIFLFFQFLQCLKIFVSAYVSSDNIFLDCGSLSPQALSYDGRNWTSDVSDSDNNFNVSRASVRESSVPEVPYMTARLFHSKFTYVFNVTPGPKFIRLHFNVDSYTNLDASKAFLTVTSGHFTLLRNFSAYLTSNYIDSTYFFKEFVVHVQNPGLELSFSPSADAYAFVNGIEIVSMPINLYNGSFTMETMYRVNVGGQNIAPNQDTGMSRSWTADWSYVFGAAFGTKIYGVNVPITYSPEVPAYVAPEGVYNTARSMGPSSDINKNYNLTWVFPVDSGFMYIIRLHFCEIASQITKINQRVFDIFINNQVVESGMDIIALSQGNGVPLYRDYTVLIRDQFLGKQVKQDLWLELHPNLQTKPQYYDAILNGVEIFKLSNEDGNLAGLNPSLINESSTDGNEPFPGPRSSKSSKKEVLVIAGTSIFGLLVIVLLVVFLLKRRMEGTKKNTRNSLCYRSFSINELKMATDDFDEAKLIDTSAFGKVYKGYIDNGNTAVTINRVTEAMSKQELDKFEVEIRNHYHIRHRNIVKLIGYCKEENEMILVYEYMPNGTLFDHLHFADQRQQQQSTLSWNQRLEICIGAARGLHYLHSATTHPIIHGDIMTKNILLDKNWTAKISCFLPSKLAVTSHNCKNLTEKSDVYSFGVVLLELLSGRPAMNQSLVQRALTCLEESKVDILVDPYLKGKIAPASLTKFIEITQKCLLDQGVNQPSMIEVLCSLELAQQLQDQRPQNTNGSARDWDFYSGSNFMLGLEFYGEGR